MPNKRILYSESTLAVIPISVAAAGIGAFQALARYGAEELDRNRFTFHRKGYHIFPGNEGFNAEAARTDPRVRIHRGNIHYPFLGEMSKPPTKAQRLAQSIRDKANHAKSVAAKAASSRPKQKWVPKGSASASKGSSTMVAPSSVRTKDAGMAITGAVPDWTEHFVNRAKSGRECERHSFTVAAVNCDIANSSNGVYDKGTLLNVIPVNRALFVGTAFAPLFDKYERWRVKRAALRYDASVGSNFAGRVYVFTDPDPQDQYYQGNVLSLGKIESHDTLARQIFATGQIPVHLKKDNLYSDVPLVFGVGQLNSNSAGNSSTTPNTLGSDRWTSAGLIIAATADNILVSQNGVNPVNAVGNLVLDIELEFWESQLTDLSNCVLCFRAYGTSTANTGTATSSSQDFYNNLVQQGNICEYAFNPAYYNPGSKVLQLPPGDYMMHQQVIFPSTTTVAGNGSTFGLGNQTGAVYSQQFSSVLAGAANETQMEFAVNGTATLAAGDKDCYNWKRIRINDVGVQASGQTQGMIISPTCQFSTSGAYYGMKVHVQRVPTLDTNAFFAYFAKGVSNSAVFLKRQQEAMEKKRLADEEDAKYLSVNQTTPVSDAREPASKSLVTSALSFVTRR